MGGWSTDCWLILSGKEAGFQTRHINCDSGSIRWGNTAVSKNTSLETGRPDSASQICQQLTQRFKSTVSPNTLCKEQRKLWDNNGHHHCYLLVIAFIHLWSFYSLLGTVLGADMAQALSTCKTWYERLGGNI